MVSSSFFTFFYLLHQDCNFLMPPWGGLGGAQECSMAVPSCCPGRWWNFVCCRSLGTVTPGQAGSRVPWQTRGWQSQGKLSNSSRTFSYHTPGRGKSFPQRTIKCHGVIIGILRFRVRWAVPGLAVTSFRLCKNHADSEMGTGFSQCSHTPVTLINVLQS